MMGVWGWIPAIGRRPKDQPRQVAMFSQPVRTLPMLSIRGGITYFERSRHVPRGDFAPGYGEVNTFLPAILLVDG